ncbi:replication protein, partial [Salmonella enterica subsp. enterica serovar Enteritidis str. 648901 6-18]
VRTSKHGETAADAGIRQRTLTGGLDAMKRELQRRVKERMMMSRGKNYTRLTMATVPI